MSPARVEKKSGPAAQAPLTLERIVEAAADVVRQYGPEKATVVDVARALNVSHAAVYKHVATKAELRDLVVGKWINGVMAPLRKIAASPGPAPKRLRELYDKLISIKRSRALGEPELFAAYRTLASGATKTTTDHVDDLVNVTAQVIEAGVHEGTFVKIDPHAAARAVLAATVRFHHPMHAGEWADKKSARAFEEVWALIMAGLGASAKKR